MNQDELLLDPLSETQFQTREAIRQRFAQKAQALAREQAGTKSGSGRDQVTPDVAPEVRRVAFPGMRGFSRANLMYMRAFAEAWPEAEIVQQAVGQLLWGHNLPSIEQIERELGGQ